MDNKLLVDVYGQMNAIERLCRTSGLKVKWLPVGENTPCTDMKTKEVYLPRPWVGMSQDDLRRLRGYAWHEAGHHHPTQLPLVEIMERDEIPYDSKLGFVINVVDDLWQEMITTRNYKGAGIDLAQTQVDAINEGASTIATGGCTDEFTINVFASAYKARGAWQAGVASVSEGVSKHGDGRFDYLIDRMNGVINHPNAAQEVVDIAREICKDEEDAGESGSGSSDSGNPGAGEFDKLISDDHSNHEEVLASMQGDEEDEEQKRSIRTIPFHSSPESDEDYRPHTPDTVDKLIPEEKMFDQDQFDSMQQCLDAHDKVSDSIARLFQSVSQTGKLYQRKRGKIVTKHLTRGAMGDPRIFSRKKEKVDTTADVYLLTDCSGSMDYSDTGEYTRLQLAATASVTLGNALERAGVPLKIAGFSESGARLKHYEIKDWTERMNPTTIIRRFSSIYTSSNSDGDSLLMAGRDLMARGNRRPILIVLSDGEPASFRGGNSHDYLKSVCRYLESKIELYGIGIESKSVRKFYNDCVVLDDPNELEKCITDVVKHKIIRGN